LGVLLALWLLSLMGCPRHMGVLWLLGCWAVFGFGGAKWVINFVVVGERRISLGCG